MFWDTFVYRIDAIQANHTVLHIFLACSTQACLHAGTPDVTATWAARASQVFKNHVLPSIFTYSVCIWRLHVSFWMGQKTNNLISEISSDGRVIARLSFHKERAVIVLTQLRCSPNHLHTFVCSTVRLSHLHLSDDFTVSRAWVCFPPPSLFSKHHPCPLRQHDRKIWVTA